MTLFLLIPTLNICFSNFRSGIPKARMAGAHFATGNVLLFLDAHCECMATWLEPLIDRIRISRKNVVVPLIDVIDAETLEYQISEVDQFELGGFTWDGHFDWIKISERERNRQREQWPGENVEILPTQSPTMAGGLFAIDREYFWEIGSYDDQVIMVL
jgi:polypeptide N-acetylgalactosaminyltransferase